jgi:hypothetical protein
MAKRGHDDQLWLWPSSPKKRTDVDVLRQMVQFMVCGLMEARRTARLSRARLCTDPISRDTTTQPALSAPLLVEETTRGCSAADKWPWGTIPISLWQGSLSALSFGAPSLARSPHRGADIARVKRARASGLAQVQRTFPRIRTVRSFNRTAMGEREIRQLKFSPLGNVQ